MGRISPLDGVGCDDIGAARLLERAADGVVQEVILATGFTAEGEATAHALAQALRARGLKVTRLARGVPAGSELEYVDLGHGRPSPTRWATGADVVCVSTRRMLVRPALMASVRRCRIIGIDTTLTA
jgi:hypothetical protein